MLKELLKERKMSIYRLAKESGVPYPTVNQLCNEVTDIRQSKAETVYRIAEALEISMDELLEPYILRAPFESFKSTICQEVKAIGALEWIIMVAQERSIDKYMKWGWDKEALYLLAMLDYLCRKNNLPQCSEYDEWRNMKLKEIVFPLGILTKCALFNSEEPKQEAIKECIPEFLRHNIVECEVEKVA